MVKKCIVLWSAALLSLTAFGEGGGVSGGNPRTQPFLSPSLNYSIRIESPLDVKIEKAKHRFIYAGYEISVEKLDSSPIPCGSPSVFKSVCVSSNNSNVYDAIIAIYGRKFFRISSEGKALRRADFDNIALTFGLSFQPYDKE